ncbi:hypothetical protein MNV49_005050 [Pseudohyphozyma bogoriensis]|nr:hypothetical protein MNV49_005050 [Pseudohyphozyma bogoriensis]
MPDVVETEENKRASDDAPTVAAVSKRSMFGSLLSRTLPAYTGQHLVGISDIEVPVPEQTFGNFEHKKAPGVKAGLALETVLFTLFYPALPPPSGTPKNVVWFPKLKQTVDGFLRMANVVPNIFYRLFAYPIAAAAIYGTTFPAVHEAELKKPPTDEGWPVIIFSHGAGCSRLMYSAICGELASRGYIVAAVEHRDGSGPFSSIKTADGRTKSVDFVNWRDLYWPDLKKQPKNDTTIRHSQLDLRLAEFLGVLSTLSKLNKGKGESVEEDAIFGPDLEWARWKGAFNTEKVIAMGHSLGGSAVIRAAADPRFSFSHIIAEDPAIQRIEPWTGTISVPFLCINSEEFAVGMDDDFPRLLNVYESSPVDCSYIFHIPGGTHPSFSDIHLILPGLINRQMGLAGEPETVLDLTVNTVVNFLKGKSEAAKSMAVKVEGGTPKRPIGEPGKLQWYKPTQ